MVLMNAPRTVTCQSSVINRTNTCGGIKKGGLAPSTGIFLSSNPGLRGARNTQWVGGRAPVCNPLYSKHPTQRYGYRATLGMM